MTDNKTVARQMPLVHVTRDVELKDGSLEFRVGRGRARRTTRPETAEAEGKLGFTVRPTYFFAGHIDADNAGIPHGSVVLSFSEEIERRAQERGPIGLAIRGVGASRFDSGCFVTHHSDGHFYIQDEPVDGPPLPNSTAVAGAVDVRRQHFWDNENVTLARWRDRFFSHLENSFKEPADYLKLEAGPKSSYRFQIHKPAGKDYVTAPWRAWVMEVRILDPELKFEYCSAISLSEDYYRNYAGGWRDADRSDLTPEQRAVLKIADEGKLFGPGDRPKPPHWRFRQWVREAAGLG